MKSSGVLLLGAAILSKDILFKNTSITSSKLLQNRSNNLDQSPQKYITLNDQQFLVSGGKDGQKHVFSPIPQHTIIDKAREEHYLSIFVRLLDITNVIAKVRGKNASGKVITILAPNNDAFMLLGLTHSFIDDKVQSSDNEFVSNIENILKTHIIISDSSEFDSLDPEEVNGREGIKSPGIHSVNLTREYKYSEQNVLLSYEVLETMTRPSADDDAEVVISTIEDPREHIGYRTDEDRVSNTQKNIIGWTAKLTEGSNTAILVKTDIIAHDGIIHVINEVLYK